LQKKTSLNGAHTAVMVCGGNIDVTLLSRIIERGLVQDGRMIRLRIHLLDKPGALAELTLLIAKYRANIVDTLYNRAYYGVNLGDTTIDITMETRGREQVEELLAALTAEGYKHDRVL
jgi:threonine dehydratase